MLWLAALGFWSVPADLAQWHQDQVLDRRGVTTTALVLAYHYDPDGGDPGGWTTDRVRFSAASGQTVTTTVGHHDPGPEARTRLLAVTYDPKAPGHARSAGYEGEGDANGPEAAVIDGAFAVMLTAAAGATAFTRSPKNRAAGKRPVGAPTTVGTSTADRQPDGAPTWPPP